MNWNQLRVTAETYAVPILPVALFALGMWLMLPRRTASGRRSRWLGAVVLTVAVVWFMSQAPVLSSLLGEGVFGVLAVLTVGSAAASMTFRSPIYSAIWFALTLLGTAGLFLFQGAQFLGVATMVVYAGAILVTFLFVLMLAQPQGHASFDRVSWEPFFASVAGACLVGLLTHTVGKAFTPSSSAQAAAPASVAAAMAVEANRPDLAERDREILHPEHVAHLGAALFSRHLIAVEVAGTLLLAALVGAIAIAVQEKSPSSWDGGPHV